MSESREIMSDRLIESEWSELERLGQLTDSELQSDICKESQYHVLLSRTEGESEHPENYEGPCLCELCMSYD